MAETYFLGMVLGVPLLLLVLALISGHFYREGPEELLDWKPTRSPQVQATLEGGELEQMLEALNRCRRRRGAPERTLAEATAPHLRPRP